MKSMSSLSVVLFLCLPILAVLSPLRADDDDKDEGNKWSIGVGPSYRGGMELRISGSSWVQERDVHAATTYRRDPPEVGPGNAPADRTYSDGWVRIDPGTYRDGLTWYWRHEDSTQYSPSDQTISFSQSGGAMLRRSIDADLPLSGEEDLDGFGLTMTLGRRLYRGDGCRVHLGISLSYWSIGGDVSASTFSESYTKTTYNIVDVYDATRGGAPPPAPYEGTYIGPGYLITNAPMARRSGNERSWDFMSARNDVRFDVDGYLLELRVGPRIDLSLGKGVWLLLTPAVSVNRVSFDVGRNENLIASYPDGPSTAVERWSDYGSESDWLFGFGLGAGIGIPLSDRWSLALQGRYDWVPQEQKLSVGPNNVEADFSGYSACAGVAVFF